MAGMDVVVRDLSVTVFGKKKQPRKLLDGLSFRVQPQEIVALMGPSGAGKTTMLNRLVGRGINGEVVGSIAYSGRSVDAARSSIGYVTQDDIMYESMTPRENLGFTAKFVQGAASPAEREAAIAEIMRKLRLEKCGDTVVGTPGIVKGISGGERKRTNVAMSLLARPALLLLDEPTSGLDSKMADELMADLTAVATQGCTVIATIHQPSEAVFARFTKVLLMEAGRVAYFGPVEGLRELLSSLSFRVPERTPLPEVLLDILELPEDQQSREQHVAQLAALRKASQISLPDAATTPRSEKAASRRLGFCSQLVVLVRRTALHVRRSKALTVVRSMQTIMATLIVAWIFMQLERDLAGVRTRLFSAFLLCFAQFIFALMSVINTFPAERAVFLREAQDRWYHPAAFYLSKVAVDSLMQCFFPILATVVGYWFIGLNSSKADRVLLFYVTLALMSSCGSSVAFAISASVSSVTTALAIAPGMILPQLLLSGLFIPTRDLPQPFKSLSYITPARYALQSVIPNEFTCEVDAACTPAWRLQHGSACEGSPCSYCCADSEVVTTKGVCPVITCEDALKFLNLDADSIWPSGDTTEETVGYNLLALLLLLLAFRLLGLVSLLLAYRRAARSG